MGTKEVQSEIPTNRQYKDRLFRYIFGDEKNKQFLLSLYNALNESDYSDEEMLNITTIENVIYMGMKNDVSFIIDSELNLFEQQSTYNPNMAFRQFEYYAKLEDSWVKENKLDIYGNKLVKIPAPRCYTFYNGTDEHEDVEILRLSDAFLKPSEGYEWTVTMLNINKGHNKKLLEQCQALAEYSSLVALVRENKETMSVNAAVDEAVKTMIATGGVLSGFLEAHRAEVLDVCITEYNEELHIQNVKQTGVEEGELKSIAILYKKGLVDLDVALEALNITADKFMEYVNGNKQY